MSRLPSLWNPVDALEGSFALATNAENEPDLVRSSSANHEPWLSKVKEIRLGRGCLLSATCIRRFLLGWKSSTIELSEHELKEAEILLPEHEAETLLSPSKTIPLTSANLAKLDTIIFNQDGRLIRQRPGSFVSSSTDVSLTRCTFLMCSLLETSKVFTIPLNPHELGLLSKEMAREEKWRLGLQQLGHAATNVPTLALGSVANDGLLPTTTSKVSPLWMKLLLCCSNESVLKQTSLNDASPEAADSSKRNEDAAAREAKARRVFLGMGAVASFTPALVYGTFNPPAQHRVAVMRARKDALAAVTGETLETTWRKLGLSDGLVALVRDAPRVTASGAQGFHVMIRGKLSFPARAVFEHLWTKQDDTLARMDPRLTETRTLNASSETQLRVCLKRAHPCWSSGEGASMVALHHFGVEPDGTIVLTEMGSPEDDLRVHAVLQEDPDHPGSAALVGFLTTVTLGPEPAWARARRKALYGRTLMARVERLRGALSQLTPEELQEMREKRGRVVNANGANGADEARVGRGGSPQDASALRLREVEASGDLHSAQRVSELLIEAIPSNHAQRLGPVARVFQHRVMKACEVENKLTCFDLAVKFALAQYPLEETWVERLVEDIAKLASETSIHRQGWLDANPAAEEIARSPQSTRPHDDAARISRILARDQDRPPSL